MNGNVDITVELANNNYDIFTQGIILEQGGFASILQQSMLLSLQVALVSFVFDKEHCYQDTVHYVLLHVTQERN